MPTKHLITASLPYINGTKHLGNLIGSMLPADVYSRYLRLLGKEVLFLCGTDEHGTPAELAAREQRLTVTDYCTQMHARQGHIYQQFSLSFDHFGRTSSTANHELTREIYSQLRDNGLVERRRTRQFFSLTDQRFLPDRYIVGTCPRCNYSMARGDQCENCAALLEPTELINPRSAISGSTELQIRESTHIFLKLSALEDQLRDWVDDHAKNWVGLSASIGLKWLAEGLQDRCITRDLQWGIAVPEQDLSGKVFYVWFDAPIGYIAAAQDWATKTQKPDAWLNWWQSDDDIEYVQFMAKDNVPFHAIMFPAMLMGTGKRWRQVDRIKGFNWLNYYGDKFSTSNKRGVFLDTALELFPPDVWRYTLLSMAPESKDGMFTWEDFQQKVNKDLNDNFGNFVNRTLRFAAARFGLGVPSRQSTTSRDEVLAAQCDGLVKAIGHHLESLEFRKATDALRDLWACGNSYFDQAAPWELIKSNPEAAAHVVNVCVNLIGLFGAVVEPFMPNISATIKSALNVTDEYQYAWCGPINLDRIAEGHRFTVPPTLFRKIDAKEVADLKCRFSGAHAVALAE